MGKGGRKKKRSTGLDALFDSTKPASEWKGGEWHAGVSAMALDDVGGGSAAAAAAATAPARTGATEAMDTADILPMSGISSNSKHAGGLKLHAAPLKLKRGNRSTAQQRRRIAAIERGTAHAEKAVARAGVKLKKKAATAVLKKLY